MEMAAALDAEGTVGGGEVEEMANLKEVIDSMQDIDCQHSVGL